jgi:hypothetical protein
VRPIKIRMQFSVAVIGALKPLGRVFSDDIRYFTGQFFIGIADTTCIPKRNPRSQSI